jgi:hypothetical protein
MKIKIKEVSYVTPANYDGRVKRKNNKMLLKAPDILILRPKPSGLVINSKKNTRVYKEDSVDGIVLQASIHTVMYKQNP